MTRARLGYITVMAQRARNELPQADTGADRLLYEAAPTMAGITFF